MSVTAATRLRKDYVRMIKDPVPYVLAAPLPSNILEWRYCIRGPPDTPYENGRFGFRVDVPTKDALNKSTGDNSARF